MIKKYFRIINKYFKIGANNKKLLFHVFLSAFLRSISLLLLPFIASKIVEYATITDFRMTLVYVFVFLSASALYVLLHHYNFVAYANNSTWTHTKLQELVFNKITKYDENFSKKISTSLIVNAGFEDLGKIYQIPDLLSDGIAYFINIIVSLVILFNYNILIGIATIILNIVSISFLGKYMDIRDYYLAKTRDQRDSVVGLIGQVLDGNKEIKSFNMKNDINEYLKKNIAGFKREYINKRKYDDICYVIIPTIIQFGKLFIYLICIYLILEGRYDVASLILVIGYYENIESQVASFYSNLDTLSGFSTRVDRVCKVLDYENENMLNFGDNKNDDIKGKIEFKNVSFTYDDVKVMKKISFKIEPNTFTAIVGKSGSGKSTIFRLLLRLYKQDSGNIYLDDVDIQDYSKDVYSSNVSIVTQKPFIFDMSIRENLNLVDSNHQHQIEACKRAGIHDFIMSLKDGYNTKLYSDAENLSIGQKQLIALARTLLSKSEVLLFDEVTSSLDLNTSKKIMEILKDLKKDHTIIMITHKPSLMKIADEIIVIDKGKIVAKGTHKELMKESEHYQVLQK